MNDHEISCKFVLDYVEKNILFIFCPHPSVWYLSSCSVADMRSFCDNIKRIPFREENREFLVAIPLIHQTTWTFHRQFFFSSLSRFNSTKSEKSYSEEILAWSTKN